MGVIGGSRLYSYLVDAAMQVGCGEAAWAVKRQALVFPAKCCRVSSWFYLTCPLGLGSPELKRGRLAREFFYFRDALFEFTNVFCDRGDFGLWSSGWGSLWVFSVRAAFFVFCRARDSVSCVCSLPEVAKGVLTSPSACCSSLPATPSSGSSAILAQPAGTGLEPCPSSTASLGRLLFTRGDLYVGRAKSRSRGSMGTLRV